jgi:Zn-dependent protease
LRQYRNPTQAPVLKKLASEQLRFISNQAARAPTMTTSGFLGWAVFVYLALRAVCYALAVLLINGLNLLPITPLDGGRVVELLSRPESAGRLALHALSIAALL